MPRWRLLDCRKTLTRKKCLLLWFCQYIYRYENIWGEHGFVFTEASKAWWSDCGRNLNNCYNYANNVHTDGLTIRSGGAVPNRIRIATVGPLEGNFAEILKERSTRDGLKVIEGTTMPAVPRDSNTNIVALFATPGEYINKSFSLAYYLMLYSASPAV